MVRICQGTCSGDCHRDMDSSVRESITPKVLSRAKRVRFQQTRTRMKPPITLVVEGAVYY